MLSDVTACYAAGGLHSCGRHIVDTLAWSSCSSPQAPTSLPGTTKGRAVRCMQLLHAVACGSVRCGRFTALMWAADEGHAHVVELLIAAGADLAAKDNEG